MTCVSCELCPTLLPFASSGVRCDGCGVRLCADGDCFAWHRMSCEEPKTEENAVSNHDSMKRPCGHTADGCPEDCEPREAEPAEREPTACPRCGDVVAELRAARAENETLRSITESVRSDLVKQVERAEGERDGIRNYVGVITRSRDAAKARIEELTTALAGLRSAENLAEMPDHYGVAKMLLRQAQTKANAALAGPTLCEAGRPEIDGECDCKPPESLADDPPREVVEVLEAAIPGEHVSAFHGDPRRVGVADRWSWSCRCGVGSKFDGMLLKEAQADFAKHEAGAAAKRKPTPAEPASAAREGACGTCGNPPDPSNCNRDGAPCPDCRPTTAEEGR